MKYSRLLFILALAFSSAYSFGYDLKSDSGDKLFNFGGTIVYCYGCYSGNDNVFLSDNDNVILSEKETAILSINDNAIIPGHDNAILPVNETAILSRNDNAILPVNDNVFISEFDNTALSGNDMGKQKKVVNYEFDYLYKDLPFEMEKVSRPEIPDYEVCLTDFGGVGDGEFLNSKAFADAVDALSEKGGGHLIVPAGIWLTGPITLKSNIDLHVTDNAVILFDSNLDLYPIIDTDFEGLGTRRCESPINDSQKNISITGGGVIDGNVTTGVR